MEHIKGTTPKDFFLWLGALISLTATLVALINLLFSIINETLPDALSYSYANGGAMYAAATLIVVFPVFIILMRVIRRDMARDASRGDIWVRRWALFFILFSAASAFVGDLIFLLFYFFNGEDLTVRFLLKVAVVLLIAGGGFLHYLADVKGYWYANPKKAALVAYAVSLLMLVVVGLSFAVFGTPAEQRMARLDNQRVSDLSNIQWQVVNYWQAHEALPSDLSMLNDALSGYTVPKDPETAASYEYQVGTGMSFTLCAVFAAESTVTNTEFSYARYPGSAGDETWSHEAGRTCFDRTIDPERYPTLKAAK